MDFIFPTYPLRTENREDQTFVWDSIRKQWVVLQPEEEVRQQMVQYLIQEKNVPSSRIGVEKEIRFNKMRKRFDVVVFDREGHPFILCECKAPSVPLTEDTLHQIARYNVNLKAKHLLLTNGKQWLFFSRTEEGKYKFQPGGWWEK